MFLSKVIGLLSPERVCVCVCVCARRPDGGYEALPLLASVGQIKTGYRSRVERAASSNMADLQRADNGSAGQPRNPEEEEEE